MGRLTYAKALSICMLVFTITQTSFAQQGLLAEYYDGKDFNKFVSAAYVDNIENAWYGDPPVPGVDPHDCSIRWTGLEN